MPEKDANWVYADTFAVESQAILAARESALQFGLPTVTPATGAQLAMAAAGRPAVTMIEFGTGTGVSGLWLLRGAPAAHLTTIDVDLDHHQVARTHFSSAGHPAKQVRLITGRAVDVLPRMNEASYDLVHIDVDADGIVGIVDGALRLARPGGTVLVAHVLSGGRVPNPTKRDRATVAYRDLLKGLRDRDDLLLGISPVGDGLLQIVPR